MTWWDVLHVPKSALMRTSASPEEVNSDPSDSAARELTSSAPQCSCFSFSLSDRVLLRIPGWPQTLSLLGAGIISVCRHPCQSGWLLARKKPQKVTCALVFKPPSHACFSQAFLVPGKVTFQFVFKPLFYVDFSRTFLLRFSTAPGCSQCSGNLRNGKEIIPIS